MSRTFRSLAAAVVSLAVGTAACAGSATPSLSVASATPTPTLGETGIFGLPLVDPLDMPKGDIVIAGSSTVFPLSIAVLTQWIDEGGPQYSIDSIGSGGGFERFCVEGASDIANASRPIKGSEVEACRAIGREPIEIRVGTDALSIVISNGNYFAQTLTIEELATLFSLPQGGTWDMVNPGFPAHPVQLFSPGADSGTFDYFNEAVFDGAQPSPILSSGSIEIVGEDDNITVGGVAQDGCTERDLSSVCAAGYFGYAYYQENADLLQVVSVDGVEPNDITVNAAEYPLARPLLMYADAGVIDARPQVGLFILYYLEVVDDLIQAVGYFPAPHETLQAAADAIAAALGFPHRETP